MGIVIPHRRIHHTGGSEPTVLFTDDFSGSFGDNWTDESNGTSAEFTGGRLRVNAARGDRYGGHVVSTSTFTPSGVQKLSCGIYVPAAAQFYDDDLTDGRCSFGLVNDNYVQDTGGWGYYNVNNRFVASQDHHIRTYFRTSSSNSIYHVNNDGVTSYADSFSHTYPSTISFINYYEIIDWDNLTTDHYDDTGHLGQVAMETGIDSVFNPYHIYCQWITYASTSGYTEYSYITLEQL